MKLSTRLHDRIRFKTWVKVILPSGPGILSNIEDISSTGIGVEYDRAIATGGECHVYFMLPIADVEHIIQARCRIAGCRPGETANRYHVGLAFLEFISDPSLTPRLIEAFVEQVELASS